MNPKQTNKLKGERPQKKEQKQQGLILTKIFVETLESQDLWCWRVSANLQSQFTTFTEEFSLQKILHIKLLNLRSCV